MKTGGRGVTSAPPTAAAAPPTPAEAEQQDVEISIPPTQEVDISVPPAGDDVLSISSARLPIPLAELPVHPVSSRNKHVKRKG